MKRRDAAHHSFKEICYSVFQVYGFMPKAQSPRAERRTVTCDVCSECTYLICSCWSRVADLSKNRFTEIPPEVCLFAPLESLNLYHNCIKCIPEAIINLQMLTYLDIRWVTANAVTFFWLLCVFLIHYVRLTNEGV